MNQPTPVQVERGRYQGIGGWLALFIFALIFVSPVSLLVQAVGSLQNAAWAGSPIAALLGIGLACFSIYAGILLWRVRRNAVTVAKRFLLAGLAIHLSLGFVSGVAAFSSKEWGEPLADAVGIVFRPLIFVGIWYSYLSRSKRVAATYGACEQVSSRPGAVT